MGGGEVQRAGPGPALHHPGSRRLTVMPAGASHLSGPQKAILAGEILVAYVRSRWLLSRLDLVSVLARLRGGRSSSGASEADDAITASIHLGGAVTRTFSSVPLHATCLTRSLVLSALLARRGIHSELVIGVEPGVEFGAHAWVEKNGRPLLPHEGFPRLHAL